MVNNAEHIVRVAIYTRVSSQEQAEKGTSLETQAEQLAAFCKVQHWEIFNHYVDGGFSGKDGNRPGLQTLRRDAKAGYFEKVIVWKLDRLARNQRLILELEAEFREQDISLFSMKEMVDTQTSIGRTVFQVLGLTAEWERESIRERTMTGHLHRMKEGCWAYGRAPYGWDYDKETKHLVINESEAKIIRTIYDLYASGKSLGAIANQLNTELVTPRGKNGKGWYSSSMQQLLMNPVYKGEAIVNRHCHISAINKADLSKAITIAVPPIVAIDKWNIAQSRLANNKHVKATEDGVFTLQGLIKCGLCGCSYRADRLPRHRYYLCRGKLKNYHLDGSLRCKNKNIRADYLEQAVWTRVVAIINDPNKLKPMLIEAISNLKDRESSLESRLLPIEKRLKEINEMKSRLADKWIIENMDTEKYKAAQQNLEKEEVRLISLRRETDPNQLVELESTRGLLRFWQNQVNSMAWNLEDGAIEDKSVMVRTMDEPHNTVLKLLGIGDNELSDRVQFPTTQRELFDKLQLRLIVFKDKIEVKAVFPMPDILYQEYTSARLSRGAAPLYHASFGTL
jgi:site-specific DNA recombinase